MSDTHLAQFNFARLRFPLQDDRAKSYLDGAAVISRVAERSAGFVWAFQKDGLSNQIEAPLWNDPMIAVNLSVWKSINTLEHFVYNTLHKSYFARGNSWFEKVEGPSNVLWWVAEGHTPTIDEALDRLAILKSDGASERAFDWEFGREHYL